MQYPYFIGLQLPPDLQAHIAQLQADLFDEHNVRRPLVPHITLLPPTAVDRTEPEELSRQAKAVGEPFWPLQLTLSKIELVQDERALVVRVESKAIFQLHAQLKALLPPEAETVYYPERHFMPHLTLCQAKRNKTIPHELVQQYQSRLASSLPATITVGSLTLFRWMGPRDYQARNI